MMNNFDLFINYTDKDSGELIKEKIKFDDSQPYDWKIFKEQLNILNQRSDPNRETYIKLTLRKKK